MRQNVVIALATGLLVGSVSFAQNGRGTAEATVNSQTIRIDYGRPNLYGRDVLSMAREGQIWRLGADQATEIESTATLVVAGTELKAGRYSLWARKTGDDQWVLAFHPATGVWGDPPLTDGFVAETPLSTRTADDAADQLTIDIEADGQDVLIEIHWGNALLSGIFGVR